MDPPADQVMSSHNEFSTNQHSEKLLAGDATDVIGQALTAIPNAVLDANNNLTRHPNLSFDDGNFAIVTGDFYFLVHRGLLCRHSAVLTAASEELTNVIPNTSQRFELEGRPALRLQDSPDDMSNFLLALYDGVSSISYDLTTFPAISGLLRLLHKYQVTHLRSDVLAGLSASWPTTLTQWETRETKATDAGGVYAPRKTLPHPILVINLARDIESLELLPSAFYDLSRNTPSEVANGYTCPTTSERHLLATPDLLSLLKGREHASRFLSTFIVNELEGREPTEECVNLNQSPTSAPNSFANRRACQAAFEAITFELLRDVNGLVCNRSSDPLYAIVDAELMQTRLGGGDYQSQTIYRACEYCRSEFGAVVDAAREEFWRHLPGWFEVDVKGNWGS